MTIKRLISCLAVVMLFCLVPTSASAISENQKNAIVDHCEAMRDSLKSVQKIDARTRVYLGGYYESILSNYIVPLNVRLVENNLSNAALVENQNKFANTKVLFADDFVSYQQDLEELVMIDCKNEPEKFYDELKKVRQKRKTVEQDVLKMRNLMTEHKDLVKRLKEKL